MTLRAALLGLLITIVSTAAGAADPKEIERKVAQLNGESVKLLGVSLNALRYLVDADGNSYLLLSHLERSGDIMFIRELEAKGYVTAQTVQGLPDGGEKNERFLRVIPIGDGAELQRCIIALQHNSALQPTR
jgi:hypothetical protein